MIYDYEKDKRVKGVLQICALLIACIVVLAIFIHPVNAISVNEIKNQPISISNNFVNISTFTGSNESLNDYYLLNGSRQLTGIMNAGLFTVTNLSTAVNPKDAVNKETLDLYHRNENSQAFTGPNMYRNINTSGFLMYGGGTTNGDGALLQFFGSGHATQAGNILFYVPNAAKNNVVQILKIVGNTDTPELDLVTHKIVNVVDPTAAQGVATKNYVDTKTVLVSAFKRGATSVSDTSTVTHGCGTTPTSVILTGSNASQIYAVTSKSSTTFTVAIKSRTGATGVTDTVNWMAY